MFPECRIPLINIKIVHLIHQDCPNTGVIAFTVNILGAPEDFNISYCLSTDFKLNKNVALELRRKYENKNVL